ncbi:DUF309 domain-containing protein [Nocardia sp. NBC_01329]|uniref:DUF309 domain-containing protein n=1 Tax=Nocardia sp. NBC_01329 TaxID=2903594 RepID=UPI002E12A23F|nr:DUF309 domain-containing protein [Nocardia sp. NBC_01329]
MPERDRDELGRAANARPRDRLGRPLPPGRPGVPRIPDDLDLEPAEALTYAQQLLDQGLAFNAHEVLESVWKNGPNAERMLWQGLAQYAVGLTHIQRGNPKGARTLLIRAVERLRTFDPVAAGHAPGRLPYELDGPGLIAHAETLLAELTVPPGSESNADAIAVEDERSEAPDIDLSELIPQLRRDLP